MLFLQFAAIVAVALFLLRWRYGIRRRNTQTWDTMLAKLRPDWSARELSDHFLWKEGLSATPEDACCVLCDHTRYFGRWSAMLGIQLIEQT